MGMRRVVEECILMIYLVHLQRQLDNSRLCAREQKALIIFDLPHLGGISLTLRLRRKYTEQDACRYLFPWLAKQDLEESG